MEVEMYLTEDYTGAASQIEYGKKGDRVTRISYDNYMSLVRGPSGLFHVRNEKLSLIPLEKPITPNPHPTETAPRTPGKTTTKRKKPINKQTNLFK